MLWNHVSEEVVVGFPRDEDISLMQVKAWNDRGGGGGVATYAASLAKRSAHSLPAKPTWDLMWAKWVGPPWERRAWEIFLRMCACVCE